MCVEVRKGRLNDSAQGGRGDVMIEVRGERGNAMKGEEEASFAQVLNIRQRVPAAWRVGDGKLIDLLDI